MRFVKNAKSSLFFWATIIFTGICIYLYSQDSFHRETTELSAADGSAIQSPETPQIKADSAIDIENTKNFNSLNSSHKNILQDNLIPDIDTSAHISEENLEKQQQCHDSNIDEVGYITDAYNQNTIKSSQAIQQILYQMKACNRNQVLSIIDKIFTDSDDVTHSMNLLLDLLPNMERTFSVISAIQQQNFSEEDVSTLITMVKDQPTGIKQALIPSIIKNDNLDNFIALTQQDNFFNSIEERNGSYPTAEESNAMIQAMILVQRGNIHVDGDIYNHLINTYPNSDTYNQLTKLTFSTNQ